MTTFLQQLQKNTTQTTLTENGAKTYTTSNSKLLDFFALAGAMRNNIEDAEQLFEQAYYEDKKRAIKCLFYIRDIRGGIGERNLFRKLYKKFVQLDTKLANKNLQHIPEFGRWDDIFVGDLEIAAAIIKKQLQQDLLNYQNKQPISIMAKWLPSENASSDATKKLAKLLRKHLNMTSKEYRQTLSTLRSYLNILETYMSTSRWAEIDYSKIPSQALRKHLKAFNRHDQERLQQYFTNVAKGEQKINTDTLFTYEVLDIIRQGHYDEANIIWDNLPNYCEDSKGIVVADVSGSMEGRPLDVAVSLALYFAERNIGVFKNTFLTFSEKPQLVTIEGETLAQKFGNISTADWGFNTNIEAVFDTILKSAIDANSTQEDLPDIIYIISDMEFDECIQANDTIFENAKKQYFDSGYQLPHIVFWNVDARNIQLPATKFDDNVTLVSGLSHSIFQNVVAGVSPIEFVYQILDSDRYSVVGL